MRWLSFSSAPLERSLGGTEVYVKRLSSALRARGVEVALATYAAAHHSPARLQLPALPAPLTRWQRWNCEPFRVREFEALLSETRPQVVHFHGSLQANPPEFMAAARSAGAKVLWTFHAPGNTCLQTALLRDGDTPCDGLVEAERCARCTLTSSGVPRPLASAFAALDLATFAPLLPSRLRHPVEVRRGTERFRARLDEALGLVDLHLTHAHWSSELLVRNGVAIEQLRSVPLPPPECDALPGSNGSVPAAEAASRRPFHLLFAGRFIDIKGLHVLAEALRGPLGNDLDLSLTVLGAPGVAAYEARVRVLLTGDSRVSFRGALTPDETLSAMMGADAVVVPSIWLETGPYTVLEAQWVGAAVVGSDLGGVAERLQNYSLGFLFPPGSTGELARAIAASRLARKTVLERSRLAATFRTEYQVKFDDQLDRLLVELHDQPA